MSAEAKAQITKHPLSPYDLASRNNVRMKWQSSGLEDDFFDELVNSDTGEAYAIYHTQAEGELREILARVSKYGLRIMHGEHEFHTYTLIWKED